MHHNKLPKILSSGSFDKSPVVKVWLLLLHWCRPFGPKLGPQRPNLSRKGAVVMESRQGGCPKLWGVEEEVRARKELEQMVIRWKNLGEAEEGRCLSMGPSRWVERDIKFLGNGGEADCGSRVKSGNGSTSDMRSLRGTLNWVTATLGCRCKTLWMRLICLTQNQTICWQIWMNPWAVESIILFGNSYQNGLYSVWQCSSIVCLKYCMWQWGGLIGGDDQGIIETFPGRSLGRYCVTCPVTWRTVKSLLAIL